MLDNTVVTQGQESTLAAGGRMEGNSHLESCIACQPDLHSELVLTAEPFGDEQHKHQVSQTEPLKVNGTHWTQRHSKKTSHVLPPLWRIVLYFLVL